MICLWQAVPLHGCQNAKPSSQHNQWSRSMWPAITPLRKSPGSKRCYMRFTYDQLGPPSSISITLAHGLWLGTRSSMRGPNIHIDVKFHWLREKKKKVADCSVRLKVTDVFIMALTGEAFHRHQCVLLCERLDRQSFSWVFRTGVLPGVYWCLYVYRIS